MIKLNKNVKLNNVLNEIYEELTELDIEEIKRYMDTFRNAIDYNIAQYGNVKVYYNDIRKIYKNYKTLQKASNTEIWEIYKRHVGYVARYIVENEK